MQSSLLLAGQSFALAPPVRCDEFSSPKATFILPCHDLPGIHPFVVRDRPSVPHHFDFNTCFSEETRSAHFFGVFILWPPDKRHPLVANELAQELGCFFARCVKRTADQALLLQ